MTKDNKLNLAEMNKLKELLKKYDEERSKIKVDYIETPKETLLESYIWHRNVKKHIHLEPEDLDYLEKLSLNNDQKQ